MLAKEKLVFNFLLFLILGGFLFSGKSVILAGYGEAASAPTCGAEKPGTPWLYRVESTGADRVNLYWDRTDRATSWTIAYGLASGVYLYGVHNFGNYDTRSFEIGSLPRGTYYFVVRANNGCMPGGFSAEWQVSVGGARATGVTTAYRVPAIGASPTPTTAPRRGIVPQIESREPLIQEATPTPRSYQPEGQVPPSRPVTPPSEPSFFQRVVDFILGLLGMFGM